MFYGSTPLPEKIFRRAFKPLWHKGLGLFRKFFRPLVYKGLPEKILGVLVSSQVGDKSPLPAD